MNSVFFLQTVLFRHLCRCWQRNKDVHSGPLSAVIIKVNRNTEGESYTAAHTWACVCEVGDRADQPLRLCRKWSHYLELLKSWAVGWLMKLWRLVFGTEFYHCREFGRKIDLAQDKMLQAKIDHEDVPCISLMILFCHHISVWFSKR